MTSSHRDVPSTIPYFLRTQIRELIIDGTFKPGQPVREQELERRYGVSRAPAREALLLLEQSGLVTHKPRHGFRVTLYTEKEIRDQYLLRAELESYGMRCLSEVGDLAPLLETLEACRVRMSHARDKQDARTYLTEIHRFFDSIVDYLDNAPLRLALKRLNEMSEPLRYNLLSRRLSQSRSLEYLRKMIDALEERRFDCAAELKREHVLFNLPHVIEAYRAAREEEDSQTSIQ
ncbi:GntR family transcriptional regulator [Allopusillimonas ginsengisoli]|uniref:GntR family transcriptional regulator n=1 Tax=Allopusillimonas ginsengisoli TaxID=453575 RepID=UPI001021411C|nr:GntR family transcriptional regulator [Allopusillimonas ginsengisoli]TEA79994.1 GntR family transcriptional regulator [Allopusillimonas ginsengisoli]